MNRQDKIQNGFAHLSIVLIAFVVLVGVSMVAWRVIAAGKKDPASSPVASTINNKNQIEAEELMKKIDNAEVPADSGGTGSVIEPSQPTTADSDFKAKFDGFTFKYPSDSKKTVWSDTEDSSGATITTVSGNVLVSYGAPVAAPSSSCSTTNNPKMYIHSAEKLDERGAPRQLYLVKYSYEYPNELIKLAAVTDWEGGTPVVGQTDKCNYQPTFQSKKDNAQVWFKISDTSDAYRSKNLSAESFYQKEDVKEALNILASGTY